MDQDTSANEVKVTAEDGTPLPFTLRDRTLDFFSGTPGSVRVVAGDREYVYSLTLPQLWDQQVGAARRGAARAFRGSRRCSTARATSGRGWRCWAALGLLVGVDAVRPLPARPVRDCGPMLLRRKIARGRGGAAMTLRSSVGAAAGAAAGLRGRRGNGDRPARRLALLLKAGAFAAIALALAQPRLTVYESKVAVAMLADTSASISRAGSADRVGVRGQAGARPRPALDARHPVRPRHARRRARRATRRAAGNCATPPAPAGHGTNLESAIRDGAAALPAGMVPRLLLVSDGNENLGSVSRAIWQAQQLGVPIDTVPLAGRPKPGLVLESVALPGTGLQRRAVSHRSHAGIAARRARRRWR